MTHIPPTHLYTRGSGGGGFGAAAAAAALLELLDQDDGAPGIAFGAVGRRGWRVG